MGPRASRNCVTSVPLGHRRWTSRRVSSGMGSKPWDFSDIGHLVSGSNRGGHLPPTGYALSLSLPHLTCSLVWTEFPNRVIYRPLPVSGGFQRQRLIKLQIDELVTQIQSVYNGVGN